MPMIEISSIGNRLCSPSAIIRSPPMPSKTDIRHMRAQPLHQRRAQLVARSFSCNDEDPHQLAFSRTQRNRPSSSQRATVLARSSSITPPASITMPSRPAAATPSGVPAPDHGQIRAAVLPGFGALKRMPPSHAEPPPVNQSVASLQQSAKQIACRVDRSGEEHRRTRQRDRAPDAQAWHRCPPHLRAPARCRRAPHRPDRHPARPWPQRCVRPYGPRSRSAAYRS